MLVSDKEEINLKYLPSDVECVSKARTIGGSLHLVIPIKIVKKLHINEHDDVRYVIHHLTNSQGKSVNVCDIRYLK